ncbi:hypothetical protein ACFLXT_01395 [Chloroflexota bacterium]
MRSLQVKLIKRGGRLVRHAQRLMSQVVEPCREHCYRVCWSVSLRGTWHLAE